jgi:hypothetical protein
MSIFYVPSPFSSEPEKRMSNLADGGEKRPLVNPRRLGGIYLKHLPIGQGSMTAATRLSPSSEYDQAVKPRHKPLSRCGMRIGPSTPDEMKKPQKTSGAIFGALGSRRR